VILKGSGGKQFPVESYLPRVQLPMLKPGESVSLLVDEVYFFETLQNGDIEIILKPDAALNLSSSSLTKKITINEHPESFMNCAASVVQSVISVAELHLKKFKSLLNIGDLATRVTECNTEDSISKAKCFAEECVAWLFTQLLGSDVSKESKDVLKLLPDLLKNIYKNEPPPCISLVDFYGAWMKEAIRKKFFVNGVVTESPVYPLVTNKAGQRTGFLENGHVVEEIPNSHAFVIGEKRLILYPGADSANVQVVGYAPGKMHLTATFTQAEGAGITLFYRDVLVAQGMKATLASTSSSRALEIDIGGDGVVDQFRPPDRIEEVSPDHPLPSPGNNPPPSDSSFADDAFRSVWERTDLPVMVGAPGLLPRTWIWGPQPLTGGTRESYTNSPGGTRLIQYFDKSRMEVNNPHSPRSPWYVTNGLLVIEMIEGRVQVGDIAFEDRTPADEVVAGDPVEVNPKAPTYRSFRSVAYPVNTQRAPKRSGEIVTAVLAKDGSTWDNPSLARYNVTLNSYEEQLGHNIPKVFTDFFMQQGLVYDNGRYIQSQIIDWIFVVGLPISEPYWTRVNVGGVEKDVLMQAFQRRVLTYTPDNAREWRVEMGNVGQHYLRWRYHSSVTQ
jgi:hypothetical protein